MKKEISELSAGLVQLAADKNITVAFAESCTGGLVGASITEIPGASRIFLGSAVTYSNEAKQNVLGVDSCVIAKYGAVSADCAEQMAAGARRIYGSDIALSVTGIAGPEGGSQDKPVGTVWFGYASGTKNFSFVRRFSGDRNSIRFSAVREVLLCIVKELQ